MHVILQVMIMMHAMIKYSWWKIILTFITWLFIICHDFEIVVKGKENYKTVFSLSFFYNDKGGDKFVSLHISNKESVESRVLMIKSIVSCLI